MTRRELLAAGLAAMPLGAAKRIDRSRFSALTDEIGTTPEEALAFARQYRLRWVEVRGIPGTKTGYTDVPEAQVRSLARQLKNNGQKVSYLDAALLKFPLPDVEPILRRPETPELRVRRLALSRKRFDGRMEDLRKAMRTAEILGTRKIRIFAFSRAAEREKIIPRVAGIIGEMVEVAGRKGIRLLMENEGSCNVATCAELAAFMKLIPSKWLGANWDTTNGLAFKERPFPDGYELLPKERLGNIHIKGVSLLEGPARLDWKAIFRALERDGYQGQIGLETHIRENLIQKSHASMREMIRLAES